MDFEKTGEHHVDKQKDGKDYAGAFYWSFEHSEGSTNTQKNLFKLMARGDYYAGSKLNSDEFLGNLPHRSPKGHEAHGFAPESTDTQLEFGSLSGTMIDVFSDPYKDQDTDTELVDKIIESNLKKDLKFQAKERTGSSPVTKEDPHASLVREYALNRKDPGHPAFLEIYDKIGDKVTALKPFVGAPIEQLNTLEPSDQHLVIELSRLKNAWEETHQGEPFFPPQNES